MNEFIEKWNSNRRFKTKIKLSLYTLFVVFIAIFAISNRPLETTKEQNHNDTNVNTNQIEENNDIIEIPDEYNYTINITINNNNYKYIGQKTLQREYITKEINNIINNYINENNNYYKKENENYILSTKEEVYDIVNYDYINLQTINEYLSKSIKKENQYIVYLKDIILDNNNNDDDEYIVITINKENIDIDYTSLMKKIDNTVEKYLINIKIENIE